MRRTRMPRTPLTIALVIALCPCLAQAALIDFEIAPFDASFTQDLESGGIRVSDVGSITVSASGASATATLGELVTLEQDITVTIDGPLASAFFLHDALILPQLFDFPPTVDPGISGEGFGFSQIVTLDGAVLFESFVSGHMLTVFEGDLGFTRTVSLNEEFFDFAPGGLAGDYVIGTTVSSGAITSVSPSTYTFGDNDAQTLHFTHTQTFSVNSLAPISVPEPGTLLLLGSALAGVGLLRRRRRHLPPTFGAQ